MDTQASWQPYVKDALRELENETKPRYVTREELDLERFTDSEPWLVTEVIKETVKGADKIEIELIDANTNLREVQNNIRLSNNQVGLVLLGPEINRFVRPYLIVITTKTKIYCIDPNDRERGIAFLSTQLRDPRLEFFVTKLYEYSDALLYHYKIDLSTIEAKMFCCTAAHVSILKTMKHSNDAYKVMYPAEVIRRSRKPIKHEKFEILVRCWLDIFESEIRFDHNQMPHLKSRPFNTTAINIIKKRCILARALGQSLSYHRDKEYFCMNENIHKKYLNCNPQVYEDVIRAMDLCREKGTIDPTLSLHVDGWIHDSKHVQY